MSLVDVLVGSAVTLIIFVALFGLLRASFLVSSHTKAKSVATAIASAQLEYVRSLPYDDIGTVGGIPNGVIAETATTTENGMTFVTRTFVRYVDDPADGEGAADETGITTDYKQVRVSVSYTVGDADRAVELVSNQSPVGIETTTGGGTLEIRAVDALGAGIPGAEVSITNPSLAPAVDLTAFTNASGVVFLPGAATSTEYRVSVTKDGYSTAQTYARDATNQNPTPGYLTVVENVTSTGTFAIDLLADLRISTFSPPETVEWTDGFDDQSKVDSLASVAVSGSALRLAFDGVSYALSGTADSESTAPASLTSWVALDASPSVSAGTQVRVQVLDGFGAPLPDAVLPGNEAGFTSFPVDLAAVSTSTYQALALRAQLSTSDTAVSPTLADWTLSYEVGPTPLPNIAFTLRGAKTVGSTGAGAAIYKTTVNTSTNASGVRSLALEWDAFELTLAGYDVVEACGSPTYALAPGSDTDSVLYLDDSTTNMILVTVKDSAGAVVPGASVTLSRTGFSQAVTSSDCGTAYFGGLTSDTYSIQIAKAGYTTTTFSDVAVSGHVFYAAPFD